MRMRDAKKLRPGDPVSVWTGEEFYEGVVTSEPKPGYAPDSSRWDNKVVFLNVQLENGEYLKVDNYAFSTVGPRHTAEEILEKYDENVRKIAEKNEEAREAEGRARDIAGKMAEYITGTSGVVLLQEEIEMLSDILARAVKRECRSPEDLLLF